MKGSDGGPSLNEPAPAPAAAGPSPRHHDPAADRAGRNRTPVARDRQSFPTERGQHVRLNNGSPTTSRPASQGL